MRLLHNGSVMAARVILSCAVIFFSGCFSSYTFPKLPIVQAGSNIKEKLLASLLERDTSINSLRLLAHAKVKAGGETNTLRYAVVLKKPDSLRIEALPINAFYSLGILVANGKVVRAIDPGAKTVEEGDPTASFIRSRIGIPAAPGELMSYVTATIPSEVLQNAERNGTLKFYREAGGETAVGMIGNFDYYWIQSIDTGEILTLERWDQSERPILKVLYSEYQTSSKLRFPQNIDISIIPEDAEVALKISSVSLNPDIKELVFNPDIPSDYHAE